MHKNQSLVLEGYKFGKLTVLKKNIELSRIRKRTYWVCICDCGSGKEVSIANNKLVGGWTRSCGCLIVTNSKTHGKSRTGTYLVWKSMKQRCLNPNNPKYIDYGGRGIKICQEWIDSFEKFYEDIGERPSNLTLHRKDNDGDYNKENCVWANENVQSRAKRNNILITYNGITKCITDWASELNISSGYLTRRFKAGWSVEKTFLSLDFLLNRPIK